MESSGSHRSGLLTAGGILSIVGGAFEVIGGGIVTAFVMSRIIWSWLLALSFMPLPSGNSSEIVETAVVGLSPSWLTILIMSPLVLGIIAIVGGVLALRRKSFGLSLAGAICALPSAPLGILAVIFVAMGKREFGEES